MAGRDTVAYRLARPFQVDIFVAIVKTIEFVLLNDDPYRIFTDKDQEVFQSDLEFLKTYFNAGDTIEMEKLREA